PEGIVDEEIAKSSQAGGEFRIVGLLAGIETRVLEQEDVTGAQGAGGAFRFRASDDGNGGNRPPEKLTQPARDWSHGVRGVSFPLRSPEVRREHDRGRSV
ncbi:MAG: hypothetical protein K0R44_1620, partial [Thermomicrobiales bacterium]|nr:hypothetical protein [Thermomicrobiales bacterium]